MIFAVGISVGLAAIWILLSGHFEPLLLGFGVFSVLLTVVIAARMKIIDAEGVPVHLLPRLFIYVPWLIWEIVKSNIDVARIIIHPKLPISPTMFRVRAGQKTELGLAIYANSITLTPGTVSVDMENNAITVHALTRSGAEGVEEGEMDRRVCRLEGTR